MGERRVACPPLCGSLGLRSIDVYEPLTVFEARWLPEIGKSTAQSICEFRKAIRNDENDATNGEQSEKPGDPSMSNDAVVTVTNEELQDERQPS